MTLPKLSEQDRNWYILKGYDITITPNGSRVWYLNNKLHREDGPAIEYRDGSRAWYLNDKLHREDGPAYESVDGHLYEWFLNDEKMTEKQHRIAVNEKMKDTKGDMKNENA